MKQQSTRRLGKIRVTFQELSKILRGELRDLDGFSSVYDVEVVGVEQPLEGVLSKWCYVYFTSLSLPPVCEGLPIPVYPALPQKRV